MLIMTCPFCLEAEVFVPTTDPQAPMPVCPSCITGMTFDDVSNLQYRTTEKENRFYLGEGVIHPNIRVILPENLCETEVPTQKLLAVYPHKGIFKNWPVSFLLGNEQVNCRHIQTDGRKTKLGLSLLFASAIQIPIWLLTKGSWVWTLVFIALWSPFYWFWTRTVPANSKARQESAIWQSKQRNLWRERKSNGNENQ